jgi:hypothetical protein
MEIRRPGRIDWRLAIGPALVVVGLTLLKVSDELVFIGPFDRAQFGWAVPIPLLMLAPAAIGLAARTSGVEAARAAATVTGLILSMKQVGCDQYPDTLTILFASVPVPLVLGLGWAAAGRFAIRFADRPILAVVAGVGGAILAGIAMILAWAAFFPGLSCAYVPPPA